MWFAVYNEEAKNKRRHKKETMIGTQELRDLESKNGKLEIILDFPKEYSH